ncbi:hypothetical protein PR048_012703 [Dryococelus australis]|uniref:Uncharacterized protein n=1 Tax=Dryococelus australis TaxID=614101 RepID=A0ABQ9HQI4_9NEOP|nr:hypothetical protein PR048_012703 [Dryococelus australis]
MLKSVLLSEQFQSYLSAFLCDNNGMINANLLRLIFLQEKLLHFIIIRKFCILWGARVPHVFRLLNSFWLGSSVIHYLICGDCHLTAVMHQTQGRCSKYSKNLMKIILQLGGSCSDVTMRPECGLSTV